MKELVYNFSGISCLSPRCNDPCQDMDFWFEKKLFKRICEKNMQMLSRLIQVKDLKFKDERELLKSTRRLICFSMAIIFLKCVYIISYNFIVSCDPVLALQKG